MTDLISRQAAIELWEEYHPYIAVKACEYGKRLRSLPSAERLGRWNIELDKNRLFYECKCSVCGHIESFDPRFRFFNYCPICGSFNGEGGENEELQR